MQVKRFPNATERKALSVGSNIMALHTTPSSMLKESLDETLEAAKFCANYKKNDPKWGLYNTGGCLGYPSGILLFSIIDTIGSYFKKKASFQVTVDSKSQTINASGWEHFKILNSKYFNQSLSSDFLKALYNKFRSSLTHNSVLGKDTLMFPDNHSLGDPKLNDTPFAIGKDDKGNNIYILFIRVLYHLCESAVAVFKKDIDAVVPTSKQGKDFH
ncbi:MAG: hypothetical protein ABI675_31095 [Chitinophagaceae bacterium]